jgi:hypothetical protein
MPEPTPVPTLAPAEARAGPLAPTRLRRSGSRCQRGRLGQHFFHLAHEAARIGHARRMKRAQQGHLRGHERIGRGAHFVVALEQQLPQAVQLARAKVCRPAFERGAFLGGAGLSFRAADLGDGDLVDEIELGAHHRHRFDPERVLVGHFLQQGGAIGSQQGGEQATLERLVGKAEHVAHLLGAHADGLALSASGKVGVADRLIEDREPVARRPFGGGGDHGERLVLGLDAFFLADVGEMLREQGGRDAPQIETLAPRKHGDRQLVDFGRGKQELHMGRRLFERLEQGVERIAAEHVNFVDDVDLVARRNGSIAHRLDDLAHVVDAGVAGRVHLDHVDMAPFGNRTARLALAARVDRRAALPIGADAVERLGDQARGAGLAHPAHAGHQKGMGQTVAPDGIGQGLDHGFLPDQRREGLRAILARQHAIGLGRSDRSRNGNGNGRRNSGCRRNRSGNRLTEHGALPCRFKLGGTGDAITGTAITGTGILRLGRRAKHVG